MPSLEFMDEDGKFFSVFFQNSTNFSEFWSTLSNIVPSLKDVYYRKSFFCTYRKVFIKNSDDLKQYLAKYDQLNYRILFVRTIQQQCNFDFAV